MKKSVNDSLNTLNRIKGKYSHAKKITSGWTEALGRGEVEISIQEEILNDLSQFDNKKELEPVWRSLGLIIDSLDEDSDQILIDMKSSGIDESINTAGTVLTTASGVLASGMSLSYPLNAYPKSYLKMQQYFEQNNDRDIIKDRLSLIDPSLGQEYNNAWQNLYTQFEDSERSPLLLIREVFRRLLDHFAPDDKVRQFLNINNKIRLTRANRIDFMNSLIKDPWKKQTFIAERTAFINIYDSLSKAHKPGSLNIEQSKNFLYQANGLIKLILNTFT